MADAEELSNDLIKRGAARHVRDCDLLINAVNRVRRAANYTAGTGKLHHDDEKAHTAMRRAWNRMLADG